MTIGATPLISLDAVSIDTETTGLDPNKARVIEFAAVRVVAGQLDATQTFERRINPGEPIPQAATRIHGIDDAAVAGAPAFATVWPQARAMLADAVLIGHTVGFDLAVLARECRRAGITWDPPAALDTRLLGEIAEPRLADHSLDSLAAWLGVDIADRHSALGDARAAARVFVALVPKLRDKGIRTYGEASRACRALTKVLDEHHRAGWSDVTAPRATAESARIDSYPYRHRADDLMAAARFVAPDVTVGAALEQMAAAKISSLFVASAPAPLPQDTGIITERDILRALASDGAAALALPITHAMSKPLATVPADAFACLAIGRMNRLKVRHLGVTDEAGRVIGALSARDLLRLRAESGLLLGDAIDQAQDVHGLGQAWGNVARVAADLLREGLSGREIAAVISRELCAMTRRAGVLAEQRMIDEGKGAPPCRYALAVLGSAGRGESLLAMDQDNALMFPDDAPEGADGWFAPFANHIADILHAAGVPYCSGGVMARNAGWRGSLGTWQERVRNWIGHSAPQDLLSVDIFFDLRGVHGDIALANTLWRDGFARAAGEAAFAKLLVEAAGAPTPALNWFGGLKAENGRIDLKKSGLFAIVSAGRALAIRHGVVERATPARLAGVKALGLGADRDLDALIDAQATFLDLILAQQIRDIAEGIPPNNTVAVKALARRERERLHAALQAIAPLETLTRELLFR